MLRDKIERPQYTSKWTHSVKIIVSEHREYSYPFIWRELPELA